MPKGRPPAKPFAKGNKLGKLADHSARGVKKFLTQQIVAALHDPDPKTGKENYVVMIASLVERAKGGDHEALEFIMERVEGKVTQEVRGRVEHHVNLDNLSDDELDKFIELHRKVVDVTPEPVDEEVEVAGD